MSRALPRARARVGGSADPPADPPAARTSCPTPAALPNTEGQHQAHEHQISDTAVRHLKVEVREGYKDFVATLE